MAKQKGKSQLYFNVTGHNLRRFCDIHNISYEDMLYGCCEGKLSNFPIWYVSYLNRVRMEIKNRMKTGVVHKIEVI